MSITSATQAKDFLSQYAPPGESLAFINPSEAKALKEMGGSGEMTEAGIPTYIGGIGSWVKDTFRKAMPNEIAEIGGQLAPIVSMMGPMGAVIGAGMAWNSEFDRTGRMGSSLKKAGKTFVTGKVGQAVGGQFGGAENVGIKSLGDPGYWTDIGFNVTGGEYVPYSLSNAAQAQAADIATASAGTVDPTVVNPRTPLGTPPTGNPMGGGATVNRPRIPPGRVRPERVSLPSRTRPRVPPGVVRPERMINVTPESATTITDGRLGPGFNEPLNPADMSNVYKAESSLSIEDPKFTERLGEAWTDFKEAEGWDKMKVVFDFMADPANKLVVQALGFSAAAVAQWLENKKNKPALYEKGDFAYKPEYSTEMRTVNPDVSMSALQGAKNGGIIGLANGGEPTMEMDYRGGGFIPVGAKERADDVPARLSKNEFVMTADAVRAAGGGSVDVGAQRMYNLMNQLEGAA